MVTYYISGYTYHIKDEIKKILPASKDFKNWWRYNYDFKCWELEVPNNINSKKFEDKLREFCNEHNVKLEVLNFTKPLTKSMNDFKTVEEWFKYFHDQSNKNIKLGK